MKNLVRLNAQQYCKVQFFHGLQNKGMYGNYMKLNYITGL